MVDWNQPLSRVLILKAGERLRTLHDAAELITRRFGVTFDPATTSRPARLKRPPS